MKFQKQYMVGALQLLAILVFFSLLYQFVFINYVRQGKFVFLGSGYFFFAVLSITPIINLILRKYKVLAGNFIGIAVYFIVFIPIAMLFGEGI